MKIPFFELERFVKENLEVKQTNNSKVQINFGKPKFTSESNSFDSKALASQIIGGQNGNKLLDYSNEDNIYKAIKRYFIEELKWEDTPLSPITFRRTFMNRMRTITPDATIVQELVGHTHKEVIDIHYNVINKKMLKDSLNKYPSFEQLAKWAKQKKN